MPSCETKFFLSFLGSKNRRKKIVDPRKLTLPRISILLIIFTIHLSISRSRWGFWYPSMNARFNIYLFIYLFIFFISIRKSRGKSTRIKFNFRISPIHTSDSSTNLLSLRSSERYPSLDLLDNNNFIVQIRLLERICWKKVIFHFPLQDSQDLRLPT